MPPAVKDKIPQSFIEMNVLRTNISPGGRVPSGLLSRTTPGTVSERVEDEEESERGKDGGQTVAQLLNSY